MSRAIGPIVLTGLLIGLLFPPFNFSYLAWFCLVPLLFFASGTPRQYFLRGYLSGFISNLIIFSWLWKTFLTAGISPIQTCFVWMLMAAYLSLYPALFFWGWGRLPQNYGKPFLAASWWVGLDFMRSTFLSGFPWALLSHSQISHPILLQIASFTGAEGLTFLIVLVNSSLAIFWNEKKKAGYILPSIFFLVFTLVFGFLRLNETRRFKSASLKVSFLQANIDPYQKWDDRYESFIRETFESLVQQSRREKPDLILWPESAIPGWFPNESFYQQWVTSIVQSSETNNLFGAVSSVNGKDTNSAFLVDKLGKVVGRYDKQHLVPFGEYIPFGSFMARWIPYLGQLGTFKFGARPLLFQLGEISSAPSICYEMVFPSLIRDQVRMGADVLINLTNDGWYLDTGAPAQHLAASILRAVENGRPVLRCANTGYSAVIDDRGRIQFQSELNQRKVYPFETNVPLRSPTNFYTKWGDWFAWLCVLFSSAALGMSFRGRKNFI